MWTSVALAAVPDAAPLVDQLAWAADDHELDLLLRELLAEDGAFGASRRADAGPWPKALRGATVYAAEVRIEDGDPEAGGPHGVAIVREAVVYTNRTGKPLDTLVLRVFGNVADPRFGFRLAAWVDGRATPFGLQDALLRVPLGRPLRPGERTRLLLEGVEPIPAFAATDPQTAAGWWPPAGGVLGSADDQVNLGLFLPTVAANEGGVWDERGVVPNDLTAVYDPAHWHVTLTFPSRYGVAATGVERSRVEDATFATTVLAAGGVRDFAATLVPDAREQEIRVGGTTVRVLWRADAGAQDPAEDAIVGQELTASAAGILRELEARFGPLDQREIDVVEAPIRGLVALDFPGLVLLDARHQRGAFHRSARHEWALAHALGHQWWGHEVGIDGLLEPWLDEGLAEHSAALYWERAYGRDALHDRFELEVVEPLARMAAGGDVPPGDQPVLAYDRRFAVLVDGRGGLLFDDLRRAFGEAAWTGALRAVRSAAGSRRIGGAEVLAILQAFAPPGVDVAAVRARALTDPTFAEELLLRE